MSKHVVLPYKNIDSLDKRQNPSNSKPLIIWNLSNNIFLQKPYFFRMTYLYNASVDECWQCSMYILKININERN